ncbi:MAG: 5-formyltetrahydrofolate cyclo-ligase, partial [Eggerthellaceae bacterium]|nr:5-formyltetrahydrofolate cyclo-ligase [Eggerthellaceae bacterium]
TWHRVTSFDGLVRSSLGVDEPPANPATRIDPTAPDPAHAVALVPGLAFDAQGYRIGYGGGYYDAFLATFPGTTVGLCRRAQLAESLCAQGAIEPHDVPVQTVISG